MAPSPTRVAGTGGRIADREGYDEDFFVEEKTAIDVDKEIARGLHREIMVTMGCYWQIH